MGTIIGRYFSTAERKKMQLLLLIAEVWHINSIKLNIIDNSKDVKVIPSIKFIENDTTQVKVGKGHIWT